MIYKTPLTQCLPAPLLYHILSGTSSPLPLVAVLRHTTRSCKSARHDAKLTLETKH